MQDKRLCKLDKKKKGEKTLKVKCKVLFISKLKVIKNFIRFSLLFIYSIFFYPHSQLKV